MNYKPRHSLNDAPKYRDSPIANSTCRDAALPICILAGETQSFCAGACGNNNSVGSLRLFVFLHLSPVSKRTRREIDLRHSLGDDLVVRLELMDGVKITGDILTVVPKRPLCSLNLSINSGPMIPVGNPGKFSTI
jgi:hypothetical protein